MSLHLENQSLTVFPGITGFSSVYLSNNNITSIPDNLPVGLKVLVMNGNNLTTISDSLPISLTYLDLRNNSISVIPDTIPSNLEYLALDYNNISVIPDTLPNSISTLLLNNNIVNSWPEQLPSNLIYLELIGNLITGISMTNPLPVGLRDIQLTNSEIPLGITEFVVVPIVQTVGTLTVDGNLVAEGGIQSANGSIVGSTDFQTLYTISDNSRGFITVNSGSSMDFLFFENTSDPNINGLSSDGVGNQIFQLSGNNIQVRLLVGSGSDINWVVTLL